MASPGCREEQEPSTALAAEAVDRACARIASCAGAGSASPADCATTALTRPASGIRLTLGWADCLEAAGGDCAAVAACAPEVAGDPCADVEGAGTLCQGDLLVSCWSGGVEFVSDCAAWGLTCGTVGERATCRGDGASCLEGSDECLRDVAVLCVGGRQVEIACGDLVEDRVCALVDGRGSCAPTGATCDADGSPGSCDGDRLTFCSATGQLVTVDCLELGFAGCTVEADRAVCGTPEG